MQEVETQQNANSLNQEGLDRAADAVILAIVADNDLSRTEMAASGTDYPNVAARNLAIEREIGV